MISDKEYSDVAGIILGKIVTQIEKTQPVTFPSAVLAIKDSPVGQRELVYVPLSETKSKDHYKILGKLGYQMAKNSLKIDACFFVAESWIDNKNLPRKECVAIFGLNRQKTKKTISTIMIKRFGAVMAVETTETLDVVETILTHYFDGYEAFHQSPP